MWEMTIGFLLRKLVRCLTYQDRRSTARRLRITYKKDIPKTEVVRFILVRTLKRFGCMGKIDMQYIYDCEKVMRAMDGVKEAIDEALKPILTDTSLIPALHDCMADYLAPLKKGEAMRIEIMVLLYLYDPIRMYSAGSQTKNHFDVNHICDALGIQIGSFGKFKKGLLLRYKLYADFRSKVNFLAELCHKKAISIMIENGHIAE